MATASPTPAAAYDLRAHDPLARHRQSHLSSRTLLRRNNADEGNLISAQSASPWRFSAGDSSDDEMPVAPMKLSAEAKALLGEEASMMETASPVQKPSLDAAPALNDGGLSTQRRTSPTSFLASRREHSTSPVNQRVGSPRIVRLTSSVIAPSTLRRSQSVREESNSPLAKQGQDLVTPAPRPRSHQSAYTDQRYSGDANRDELHSNSGHNSSIQETAAQMEGLSIDRSKGEDLGLQTTQRQKRGLKVTGRLLSGPARRGLKRRQSDEDQSPVNGFSMSAAPRSRSPQTASREDGAGLLSQSTNMLGSGVSHHRSPLQVRFQGQQSIKTGSPDPIMRTNRPTSTDALSNNTRAPPKVNNIASSENPNPLMFKIPPLPPLPSRFDQENEPPPTFKRNKPSMNVLLDDKDKLSIMADSIKPNPTPASISPKRQPLAARSQNTPHRPAPPPPPKMTVLETATATAGAASASQARKKRNQYMSVNGRYFTRMDCIGRGGSSKVYRVMAENFKIFALKRVTLEDQDELAIRGYKGEIDLLRKLENVDRVVRLFDYEINEEKHTLSVLMEMGESDLNRVLTQRLNGEDSRLDITFTRYFWKEMLECVQAVHAHDIVHSDLKPANFLLLQGRLKLIDFGISNAIADDTVNVHREQHIGTPNYMSPEALIDSNAAAGLPASEGKMMKLGKPSDVWSLGCILYQMVYGKPPFAHIANQMQRIMAIPNPRHTIGFPETGVGGAVVPLGLIRTLRRCLTRDPTQRPTVDEMLAEGDPFLCPDVIAAKDTVPVGQELIARLQHNIIKHVREKGLPSDAELATWPARFFASIKAAVEEGRA